MPKSLTIGALSSSSSSADAQEVVKKFANAKSISSDQFFGGDQSNDVCCLFISVVRLVILRNSRLINRLANKDSG